MIKHGVMVQVVTKNTSALFVTFQNIFHSLHIPAYLLLIPDVSWFKLCRVRFLGNRDNTLKG